MKSPALWFWLLREGVVHDDPPGDVRGLLKDETQSRARISALDVQNCVEKERKKFKKSTQRTKNVPSAQNNCNKINIYSFVDP